LGGLASSPPPAADEKRSKVSGVSDLIICTNDQLKERFTTWDVPANWLRADDHQASPDSVVNLVELWLKHPARRTYRGGLFFDLALPLGPIQVYSEVSAFNHFAAQ
jgi:hypothetical protein